MCLSGKVVPRVSHFHVSSHLCMVAERSCAQRGWIVLESWQVTVSLLFLFDRRIILELKLSSITEVRLIILQFRRDHLLVQEQLLEIGFW